MRASSGARRQPARHSASSAKNIGKNAFRIALAPFQTPLRRGLPLYAGVCSNAASP
jgi:hypothetical protein